MSSELDHIQLSPLLVGEWYKDALLLSPDGPPAPQRPAEPEQPKRTPEPTPQPPVIQRTPEPAIQHSPEPAPVPMPQSAPAQPQAAPQPPQAAEPAAPHYKFLGKNNKKITILVQSPSAPFLPDNQLTFLTKILEACRMNIGDVAIVNTAAAPVNITALRLQLAPAVVLLFGIEPTAIKLPINFPAFKIQPYDNCSYLSAPPLTQLVQQTEESKLLKSKLWVCLKSLFNV